MSIIKDFSKDTIVYGLGKAIKKFIGFLLLPLYTRVLSPNEFGIIDSLGTLIFLVTTFFNFGLDTASGYFYFQPSDEKEKGRILYTVFILRLVVIIPAVIFSFFSSWISVKMFGSDQYTTAVLITLLTVPLNMLMSEQELVFRFNRQAWAYNILTLVKTTANIAGGIILVVNLKLSVTGAQMASMFSTFAVVLVSFSFFTRKKYVYSFSWQWAKKLLKYGYPLIWGGMAVWIYSVSDRFFLLHYKSLTEIGYYSIGSTFSQPISLVNMAIQMSFGPLFYSVFNGETDTGKPKSKQFMKNIVSFYISLACIFCVALSVFSSELVGFITTKVYLPGIVVIPVLLFYSILAQLSEIVPVGISISEKTWYFTWSIILGASLNAGLNFIFIPLWGYLGAAITTLLAGICNLIFLDSISKRFFDGGYNRYKIYILLIFSFVAAFLFPFLEIVYNCTFPIYTKVVTVLVSVSFPFVVGLINLQQVKNTLKVVPEENKVSDE